MEKILEVENLVKSYKDIKAVDDISFYLEKNKVFAFLGPNGAGKSTTINILCTFLQKDSGKVIIDGLELGKNDHQIREKIGVVFQDGVLDPLLSVKDNLKTRAGLYGNYKKNLNKLVEDTAHMAGVDHILKRPYGKLSGGQRRRCDIARALLHQPKILFLDEPTTGLDPQTRKNTWETIETIQKSNDMTIFLTTHYMEEAALADYIIIIDEGKIAAKGSPAYLRETFARDKLSLMAKNPKELSGLLFGAGIENTIKADCVLVGIPKTLAALEIINKYEGYINGFEVMAGTMDDAFLEITGKEIRE